MEVLETVIYADDLDVAAEFYGQKLGLELLSKNELMLVMRAGKAYLLVLDASKSSVPGRLVPSHGMSGAGHVAFVADEGEREEWKVRLANAEIDIESIVEWDGGRGDSIYVRDPAGNSVEFAPPGLWSYLHE